MLPLVRSFKSLKWVVYNLLFAPVFALMLPGFLLRMLKRGGYRARMLDRFAVYPKNLFDKTNNSTAFVWIHAVSVGEVQVAGQLMREWRKHDGSVRFCFSTTSSTGWKMAQKEVSACDVLIYNPLDFPTFVKAAMDTVCPRAIILTESEIWPNFIRTAKRRGIPIFLINARVSDRSAPRYKAGRFFFADIFKCFTFIFAQSELDSSRLLAAGAPKDIVKVSGSFKFDVAHRDDVKESELRKWLVDSGRFPDGNKILLGGSTWPGEDCVLLSILQKLPKVSLVLAPRHFEKADAVESNILASGYSCLRRSTGKFTSPDSGEGRGVVFLSDTTGELMGLYGIADVVFVGKSLCEHGSQNMIEPCLCGKPTVVGPYTENFRPVMSDLLERDALIQVKNKEELEAVIIKLFAEGDGGLSSRAAQAVNARKGVVPRCVKKIVSAIESNPIESKNESFSVRETIVKTLIFIGSALAAVILAVIIAIGVSKFFNRAENDVATALGSEQMPKPEFVKIASAYVTAITKPDAKSALVIGSNAGYAEVFGKFIPKVVSTDNTCAPGQKRNDKVFQSGKTEPAVLDWNGEGRFDIVFASGPVGSEGLSNLVGFVSTKGVFAQVLDVRKLEANRLKELIKEFPCPEVHLWMVSQHEWLLTGRPRPRKVKLGAMLEFFLRSGVISTDAEKAGCGSIQDIMANYVGSKEEILPAFEGGDLSAVVKPEFFISNDLPAFDWIIPDGVDSDMVDAVASSIRSRLATRKKIVRAEIVSREKGSDERALAMWAEAMRENPCDTMLLDRLYTLAVNARAFKDLGKTVDAAYCYETMIAIRPNDIRVIEEYAALLLQLGKRDLAGKILSKVREMKSGVKPNGASRYGAGNLKKEDKK